MGERLIGVVMNGVTGRMGATQHLARSIMAIRNDGGIALADGDVVVPDPVLVGRSEAKLVSLAKGFGLDRWTTDLDSALADENNLVYFDAQATEWRAESVRAAIEAGKHVYCEKPVASDLPTALGLAHLAAKLGVKNGVVQDKLFLPGMLKLKEIISSGVLGRLLSVRADFGYWVFDGDWRPAQRPSWNYRLKEGGGIILDMLCHWRYLLDALFGGVRGVSCLGATHVPERTDEHGRAYSCTAEDAAYATFLLGQGGVAQFNSSWATRVYRDDLLQVQVDGTQASAVAGLHRCRVQHRASTPYAIWDPDVPAEVDYRAGWVDVPDTGPYLNAFRAQWEAFLRHVVGDEPFAWDLQAGARGVQLAELATRSWRERRWVDIPEVDAILVDRTGRGDPRGSEQGLGHTGEGNRCSAAGTGR